MYEDDFGDRMKEYERKDIQVINRFNPIYARIDGRSFSKLTKGLQRPFDPLFTELMNHTTSEMVRRTGAIIGYTQSDEISLLWDWSGVKQEAWFGGKVSKLNGILPSMAASLFQYCASCHCDSIYSNPDIKMMMSKIPHFDCRIVELPSKAEAVNMLLWRAMDAKKNGIQSIARAHFSHKECQNKSQNDMLRMLEERDINLNRYSTDNRFGMWFAPKTVTYYSEEHECEVTRQEIDQVEALNRPFNEVLNRMEVVYERACPVYKGE